MELARTFKVYSKFLLETEAKTDDHARRDALGMNTRAEAIFTRLRITQSPVEMPQSGRGSRPPG